MAAVSVYLIEVVHVGQAAAVVEAFVSKSRAEIFLDVLSDRFRGTGSVAFLHGVTTEVRLSDSTC
jgi:hypothetical protein